MSDHLYLATSAGLYNAVPTRDGWKTVEVSLPGQHVTCVVRACNAVIAGTDRGIWCSSDGAASWQPANVNLTIRHVRWLTIADSRSGTVLAGTQPAGIFVSHDGARTWRAAPEVEDLRDRWGWFLPYASNAGCVRGFALSSAGRGATRMYAAVEVGGVLCSDDGGRNWQLVAGSDGNPNMERHLGQMIHPDVHSITLHPTSSTTVIAATGGGIYKSTDAGGSWKNIYPCYIRAVWIDPSAPQRLVAGPAEGVATNGRIEGSTDGGQSWKPAMQGLPARWADYMVERFLQSGNRLWAVLSNGELWCTSTRTPFWQRALPDISGITALWAG